MRRVRTMRFAPGMHVFPGGAVEERDFAAIPMRGTADARGTRDDDALGRALLVCAIRETLEETGVLIACGEVAVDEEQRLAVEAGAGLSDVAISNGVHIAASQVPLWSHWVTPEIESRRFDVRFYVARLPEGQATRSAFGEADHVRWITPRKALQLHGQGELPMLPPTSATLAELADFSDVAAVLAHAPTRLIAPLLPHRAQDGSWSIVDAYTREVIHPVTEDRVISEVSGIVRTADGAMDSPASLGPAPTP